MGCTKLALNTLALHLARAKEAEPSRSTHPGHPTLSSPRHPLSIPSPELEMGQLVPAEGPPQHTWSWGDAALLKRLGAPPLLTLLKLFPPLVCSK